DDRPVTARYVMVSEKASAPVFEVEITDDVLDRLRDVVGVIVDGITGGRFPARPGDASWRGGWEHCEYCAFDRLCQASRDGQWDGKSGSSPEVAGFGGLGE